ncbi:LytR C-terminal domain-containing protein [Allostreptomyces psammosilenae]|uniref:LytR/CpsA/Psr regulator C-terminal domain-containing protein n=1 Tax=Allostreptomyces psammosilenae TaxID=1892865 RepID=A0A852ZSW0_9ACTN|nr:LytR C-terminal domain-containing protein [Allostreptomyces psammosilenae]NYI05516.1 hypothetical protein [Allostreptomyces psammosilenae]
MRGRYQVTGKSSLRLHRPDRRRRHLVATSVAVATLSLMTLGAVQLVGLFADPSDSTAGTADCPPSAPLASASPVAASSPAPATEVATPTPEGITVNVFNATTRAGLAAATAEVLRERGFTVGEVANAPAELDKRVGESARVIGGPAAEQALLLVSAQVADSTVRTDERRAEATVVDLVIGDAFTELATPEAARETLLEALAPSPAPTPSAAAAPGSAEAAAASCG